MAQLIKWKSVCSLGWNEANGNKLRIRQSLTFPGIYFSITRAGNIAARCALKPDNKRFPHFMSLVYPPIILSIDCLFSRRIILSYVTFFDHSFVTSYPSSIVMTEIKTIKMFRCMYYILSSHQEVANHFLIMIKRNKYFKKVGSPVSHTVEMSKRWQNKMRIRIHKENIKRCLNNWIHFIVTTLFQKNWTRFRQLEFFRNSSFYVII